MEQIFQHDNVDGLVICDIC